MNIGKSHVSLLATLLLLAAAYAQTPATPQATPKPTNESQLIVQSIVPNSVGITVSLTASQVQDVGGNVEKQNPGTGNWMPMVGFYAIPMPGELIGSQSPTTGAVTLPIVVQPDPNVFYRLSFWTRSKKDENMDWNYSVPMTFTGYRSTVSQTFNIEFGSDALKISAATSNLAKLTAAWQFPGGQAPVDAQESTESQNPQVSLSFGALQAKKGSIPSLVLTLVDRATNQTQEARLTLTVASTPAVSQKVQQITTANNPAKQSLSWGDIAKTGISALLKFFTKA